MAWIKVDIVEVLEEDSVLLSIVDNETVRSSDHPLLKSPIQVPELIRTIRESCAYESDEWEGVWRQFQIDFPRYQMYLNRIRCTNAIETLVQLREQMDEVTVRQIVALATQGALADVYFKLVALLVRDQRTHVVDGAGAYHIHIEAPEDKDYVSVKVSKLLGLTQMDDEDQPTSIARIRVVMKVQLRPVMRGTETLEIQPV